MNDAVFKFKRYEDSSLTYTGIDKHKDKDIGGWDTVIKREEYERLFYNQQSTMDKPVDAEEPEVEDEPIPEVQKPAAPVASKPALITESFGIKKPEPAIMPAVAPVQVSNKEETDFSSVDIGIKVTHKVFGAGTIAWIDKAGKHIRVRFTAGEKTFVFPDAFKQGFLKL